MVASTMTEQPFVRRVVPKPVLTRKTAALHLVSDDIDTIEPDITGIKHDQ